MWPLKSHGYGKPCELRGAIPFSGRYSSLVSNGNNRNRLKQFQRFIGWDTVPEGLDVLDVGAENFIGSGLGIKDFTSGNLNRVMRTPKESYDVVTCFEVLNHLMNHEDALRRIHAILKPGGRLYLSTPKAGHAGLAWIHGEGNYVELRPRALRLILEYVGFKIIRHEYRNPWPWWFPLTGIRPPFRYIFNRYQLVECVKE